MFFGTDSQKCPHPFDKCTIRWTKKNIKNSYERIKESGWFLGALLNKINPPVMETIVSLIKILLVPHGLVATTSAVDAGIQKRIPKSGLLDDAIKNNGMNTNVA